MTTEKIRIGSLDFEDIKTSLKDYLNQQNVFTDHNFEGSGLAALINVLAYNAHYDSLAANFLANEMFLDTAVKRSSVVSHAKSIGYAPRSKRAAIAQLQLTFYDVTNAANIESIVLPKGSKFSCDINGEIKSFTTREAVSLPRSVENAEYIYRQTITVYEGSLTQQSFTYNTIDPTVNIPNSDIDTSTLKVEVRATINDAWEEYQLPSSFLSLTDTSNVYFIGEGFNGYDLEFGDGVFGKQLLNGSQIRTTYVVTSGLDGNEGNVFNFTGTIAGTEGAILKIATISPSAGGLAKESIDSIRSNATLQYGTQNRAVISSDYAALTLQNFPFVSDCLAWDGSDNTPPKFGKVVLCAKPVLGDVLTTTQKNTIASFLESKGVANTKVDFADPEYIELIVNTTVRYDKNKINIGTYELEYITKIAISDYAKANIMKFGGRLRYSNLVKAIDAAEYSIVSNLTELSLLKVIRPNLFSVNNIRFEYVNEIEPSTFVSTKFFTGTSPQPVYLADNGRGSINVVYDLNGARQIFQSGVGTLDYNIGLATISNLMISSIEGLTMNFTAKPVKQDVSTSKNIILNLSTENIEVSVLPDYS